MKPNFTLSLSFDGIRILHRAAGGWRVVGEVALDAADMATELAMIRRTATALDPGGLRTKLLLPNAQIKYLTIDAVGLDDAALKAAARNALDGATPYPVDDLAFDICVDGPKCHIAAVARETLAEAEAFAVEHRFHPVYFAAVPAENPFLGEPFFGPTVASENFLDPNDSVERDGVAVVVIGDVASQSPPVPPAAPAESPIAEDPISEAPEDADETSPDLPAANIQESETTDASPSHDESPTVVEIETDPEPPEVFENVGSAPEAEPVAARQEMQATTEPEDHHPAERHPDQPVDGDVTPHGTIPKAPSVQPPAEFHELPAPTAGFASRRGAPAARAPSERREPLITAPSLPPDPSAIPADIPPETIAFVSAGNAVDVSTEASVAAVGGFLSRRKAKPTGKAAQRPNAPAAPAPPVPHSEAERLTVFGARPEPTVGGKPRFLGLMLTAALLLFLAGVAAWASVFLDDELELSRLFGDRAPRQTATVAPDTDIDPPAKSRGIQTASLEPVLTEEDSAVLDALRAPIQPSVTVLASEELEANYAISGFWPKAPEMPPEPAALIGIDDLYLTSIDPISTSNDAIALPAVASLQTDLPHSGVSSPLAAGVIVPRDERGLVLATVQGTLSPEGFTIYLGPPPILPPPTPTRFQPVAPDLGANTALAAFRPRIRPNDLAETTERAQLDGLTRNELAGYRPLLRPRSLQQQVAEAQAPPQETQDTATAEEPAPPDNFQNETRLAIKASSRPDTRPRNFSRIVKRAQRTPTPEPEESRVASRTIAPKTVSPKIPSKTSVARQATVKNAINLRKVNLIGVYGKPSSRRALVRLSSGRYKKVVVGDRIDGGRISAIGDSELRYTKSGRSVVLKMPKG